MPNISVEIIEVLRFLLPGFITTTVFYSFTSYPKANAFGQIIYALISTTIIQAIMPMIYLIENILFQTKILNNNDFEFILSTLIAILLGIISSYLMNNDTVHGFFRRSKCKITRESSYPSEWYFAFARHPKCYVVLHMSGERRLYGWATEWPGLPDKGHFLIEQGEWLVGNKRKPITGATAILISVSEVEMVEFLPQVPVNKSSK